MGLVRFLDTKEQLDATQIFTYHSEFVGKVYPQCTMYCSTPHHPGHTEQCIRRRKGK